MSATTVATTVATAPATTPVREAAASPVLRRWLVLVSVAALVVAAAVMVAPRLAEAIAGPEQVVRGDGAVLQPATALVEHRVVPGDTLWDLAASSAGGGDPRPTVDRIMRLNGMQAPSLTVGDVVLVPSAG